MARSNPRTQRHRVATPRAAPAPKAVRALIVIDDVPLKRIAWAELQEARRRHDKAARDLHRHEQVDVPAYDTWLHRTFPTFVTRLRELHQDVFTKGRRVEQATAIAEMTGRPARKIWRELRELEANPPKPDAETDRGGARGRRDPFGTEDDFFEDEDDGAGDFGADANNRFDSNRPASTRPRPGTDARDVYRRLVQRLHPDRGGEWTASRQRLWHEIQQAWSAGDADWLMRLEVEWEAVHDVLSAGSPLSRLRAAIAEFHAARRDTESKLRDYRDAPAWRFTLSEKKRDQLHRRTATHFHHDIDFLERQLAYLDATIARWEKSPRPRRRSHWASTDADFDD